MEKKYITSERGQTYYWVHQKSGSPADGIVFCHGLTADHTLFDKQIAYWKEPYTVITWDMPLHGESRPYHDFTLNNAATELKAILDAEEIRRCVLIGQSAGGYVGQAFIRQYPHQVAAFVGLGTTPLGTKYYTKSDLFWLKHFSAMARWYPYGWYCRAAAKAATYTEEARENFYQALVRLGKKDMLKATKEVYTDFANTQEEVEFTCPVLLTIGEYDKIGLVQKYNQQWAHELGVPLVTIKNAAHNANYDNHTEFNQVVKDFLDSSLAEPRVRDHEN